LTPNVNYSGRTAPLTSKVAFYIFIQQIQVLNILNVVYTLRLFSLQNAVCFIILNYLFPVLFTFYVQGVLKLKNNSGAKRLKVYQGPVTLCVRTSCERPQLLLLPSWRMSGAKRPLPACLLTFSGRTSALKSFWFIWSTMPRKSAEGVDMRISIFLATYSSHSRSGRCHPSKKASVGL